MDVRKRKSLKKYSPRANAIQAFDDLFHFNIKKSHKNEKSGKKDKNEYIRC